MEKFRILWASRHVLDAQAEASLRFMFEESPDPDAFQAPVELVSQEVLWPAEASACEQVASDLLRNFDCVAGVFPAQAVEAFLTVADRRDLIVQILSPVSIPETEPDVKKVRPFRFVRWARLWPIG